eukprot:3993313-Karenia_brevis.AAC.1
MFAGRWASHQSLKCYIQEAMSKIVDVQLPESAQTMESHWDVVAKAQQNLDKVVKQAQQHKLVGIPMSKLVSETPEVFDILLPKKLRKSRDPDQNIATCYLKLLQNVNQLQTLLENAKSQPVAGHDM